MVLNDILMVISINSNDYLKLTVTSMFFSIVFLFVLITFKICLNHRKYSHIPGPPNKGYFLKLHLTRILFLKHFLFFFQIEF
jgi:glucan phosphoethanolaminetransferase (alkaline phosphatase superfamily)